MNYKESVAEQSIRKMDIENKRKKKVRMIVLLTILAVIIFFIGFKIGKTSELNNNTRNDISILTHEIYHDVAIVSFLLEDENGWDEDATKLTNYNGSYVQLMRAVEQLKTNANTGSMYLNNDSVYVNLNGFEHSVKMAFSIFEGLTCNSHVISTDFFEDGKLDEAERAYIEMLAEDFRVLRENMDEFHSQKESEQDIDEFMELVQPFIDKYDIGENLLDLTVK